jgi:hypothetical protein
MVALLGLWLACAAQVSPGDSPASGASTMVGVAPNPALSVPEFSALNQEGAPRSRADLLGHPTVLWYFPAAGTPG